MKINMPVTNKEVTFDESEFMLTKTDLKGNIAYTNHSFIKISGYSAAELIGANHNIVRHPDMPEEAFEDLWRNLQAGRTWTGMVKGVSRPTTRPTLAKLVTKLAGDDGDWEEF